MSNKTKKSKKAWVPEIFYENEGSEGGNLPFIQVPQEEEMPKLLFIFESRETGEFEPGPRGEELPVTDLLLHQYVDMESLKKNLTEQEYDRVRSVLGLLPLKEATEKGRKITESVRENFVD
jgi:hypothetical protein